MDDLAFEEGTLTGIMGRMSTYTGKKIEWDYANLRATNAPEATPFIQRPAYRKGWQDILKA